MFRKLTIALTPVMNKESKSQNTPESFIHEKQEIKGAKDIANEFNNYFINVGPNIAKTLGSKYNDALTYLEMSNEHTMFLRPTDSTEITKIVGNMKNKSSFGYDLISPKILKSTIKSIVTPLAHIINLSMLQGKCPSKMKIAKVIPIHKAEDTNIFKNYRPISLLPVFSKVLEKVIFKRVFDFCNKYDLLFNSQYGFRNNHSTEHALLEFQNRIGQLLSNNNKCLGVFMDLSKAFDTINHEILLKKLEHYGIRGISLNWFKSYLTDRSQFVYYNDTSSESNAITCGVSTVGGRCWSTLFATSLTLNIVVPANLALETVLLGRSASVLGIVANRAWLLLIATKWTVVTLWARVAIVHRQASWSGRSGLSLADIARGAVNALVGHVESGVESTATGETGALLVPVLGVARTVLTRWAWNFSWAAWWAVSTKLALDVLISSAWAVETWWTLLWLTGTWWAVVPWITSLWR